MSDMSNQELLKVFGKAVLEKMENFDNIALFLHLKDVLKTSFERVKGAWSQYKDKEIDKEGLITSGVYVLGEEFINAFLDASQKQDIISKGPKPEEIKPEPKPEPKPEVKVIPDDQIKPIEEEPPKTGLTSLDLNSLDLEIQIPSILFDEGDGIIDDEPLKVTVHQPEKPKFPEVKPKPIPSVMPLQPQVFSGAKPTVKPIPKAQSAQPAQPLTKIEHLAPEKKTRSSLDALHTVDIALDKVKLEPLKFDKVADSELKSVNVGAQLPGNLVYDLMNQARDLIYEKEYDEALKKLEEVRENAERNDDDEAFDRAVEMMASISAYKMISVLLEAGDKVIDQPGKAAEKYKKALGFAKTLRDDHYLVKIRNKLNRLSSDVNLMIAKKDYEEKEDQKIKNLMKQNIIDLSKKESLISINEIMKYCNAKSEEVIAATLIEMIKSGEVFAKFFVESGKVMFDKQANREKIRLKIDI